ncbi:MAG: hypothetical protein B6D35_10305, partial [Candidatus Brocadia sp. UTAMX2]
VYRQIPDAFPDQRVKPKIMVLAHEFVPSGSFFPTDGSYFNAVKTARWYYAFSCLFMVHESIIQEPF